jgi:nitroimidazol reductase NimA-like FMN-containing flavoprotein (pyridoxamine 5'-phosphate oxidase superfamily)
MRAVPEHTPPGAAKTPSAPARGDLGRRIAWRREDLGLTTQEVADRAGVDPAYLQYLEESAIAAPSRGTVLRLASALRTTVTALTGGEADLPPGPGQAARHPTYRELDAEECWRRLSTHGVGRLAAVTADGPTVLPVNYSVIDGVIAFRIAPDSAAAHAVGASVAFEVDHIDEVFSQGWSVLLRGRARAVTDPDAVRRLAEQAYSTPWAGGRREMWVCVDAVDVTGRAITESSYDGRSG